jgi:glucokinase
VTVFLGLDRGATTFRLGARSGEPGAPALLARASIPADGRWTAEDIARETAAMLEDVRRPAWQVRAIGFGMTGDIDFRDGACYSMKRFPGLEGVRLAEFMSERFGVPVRLLNDGLAAALGELRAGAGRGLRDFVMVTLGTGIGGGVVLDGRLLTGERGRVGKAGHQIIDVSVREPVRCHCGLPGCWQSLVGKEGMVARAREKAAEAPGSALHALAASGGEIDLKTLAELAAGDAPCRETLEETGRYVGIGLANLVKVFAPQALIIGGGIAEGNRVLLDAAQRTVREYAIKPYQDVPLLPAQLGQDAGLIGASFWAEERGAMPE